MKKTSVTFRYAFFQAAYWTSSVLVYGYTRVFLEKFGYGPKAAGVVLATGALAAAFLQPLLGAIMHRRRLPLRTVLFAITALSVVCALAMLAPLPAPAIAAFFTVLAVMTNSSVGFLNSAAFALQREGETVNFSAARGVGSVCYALMSKFISTLASPQAMLACQFTAATVLAALTLTMLPRRDSETAPAPGAQKVEGGFFARNMNYMLILLGQVLLFFLHHIITGYLLDITLFCGGTEAEMGTAILIGALAEMPGMVLAGYLMKKYSPAVLLQCSVIFYFVRTALFLLFPSLFMIYVLEGMQMVSFAFLIPALAVFAEQYACPADRLRCQTLNTGTNAAAGFLGFLLGGILVEKAGIYSTLRVAFFVSVPGMLMIFIFAGRAAKALKAAAGKRAAG